MDCACTTIKTCNLKATFMQFPPCFYRDFMDHNMERTNQMLALIHAIIEVADAQLALFLRRYIEQKYFLLLE